MKSLACILLLIGCAPPTSVATQPVYTAPWVTHTVVAGAATGHHVGADGVDVPRAGKTAVPWEQGNTTSIVDLATGAFTDYPISQSGPEDARLCDLDGDGLDDLVIAASGGAKIYLVYGGTSTVVTVSSSTGHARWIQVGCGDFDGDGKLDLVAGSYAGTATAPAVIAVFYNTGSRIGTTWTYQQVTLAGWAMSVIPRDMDGDGRLDIVVTDRASYKTPDNVIHYDLAGLRWERNGPDAWATHTILGSPYSGDEMFGWVGDFDGDGNVDLIEGRSHTGQPNRIGVYLGPSFALSQTITDSHTDGHYQGLTVADIDRDGANDIVVSSWESNTCCSDSITGVWWMRNLGSGSWEWEELSGGTGTKYDNVLALDMDGDGDLDVLDTEQVDQQGLIWFENPGF